MLNTLSMRNFGGVNTVNDSVNTGTAMARTMKNMILRPLGGLGMPAAWAAFKPGGTALDLSYLNNADYLFDGGRLLLQDSADVWWDVTPRSTGAPNNITVTAPSSTLSANLVLTSSQHLVFKYDANTYFEMKTSQYGKNWYVYRHGNIPYYTTRYTADRAFTKTYGPVIPDGAGNSWKLQADPETGLYAVTI